MNLHGIAGPIVSSVNPTLTVLFYASNSFTQADDFSQQPNYLPAVPIPAQVQQLTAKDLQKIDALNIQQSDVAIYLYGASSGVVRVRQKGGDLITVVTGPAAGVYLVTVVLEQWPDWVKVAATLQNQDVDPTLTPSLDFSDPNNSQNLPGGTSA